MSWPAIAVLLLFGVALFTLPHRSDTIVAEKRTLWACFAALLQAGEWKGHGGKQVFRVVLGSGCLSVFLPALVGLGLRHVAPGSLTLVLVLAAVALGLCALALAFVILLAHTNFGMGASRTRDGTVVARLAPAFVAFCAIVAVVAAFSDSVAGWVMGS